MAVGFSLPSMLARSPTSPATPSPPTRVLRVIARMNVGGPAYHVSLLSGRLDQDRYRSLLVCGRVGPGEIPMTEVAERYGAELLQIASLGPQVRPLDDLRALVALVRLVRRFRPHIVETHTAKAGFLGRLAAVIATRPRPILVHTYHGHVLEGYFGPLLSGAYRLIERLLGFVTDRLVGVSQSTVDDLVRLGVARREKFRVIPLGLDLSTFATGRETDRDSFRDELGLEEDEVLVTYVGRIVPIKRLDVLLRAVALARGSGASLRLAIVGDGRIRPSLEGLAEELGIGSAVHFVGYRSDVATVAAGSDVAVLSSDNEGMPMSLVEAGAAGRPAVATSVGGVPEIVSPGTGILVPPGDFRAFAQGLISLADDAVQRGRMGERARQRVLERFGEERLLADVVELYEELLDGSRRAGASIDARAD